jgi:photosystem II stability/assembly factor-like uncharacterized protein
MKKNILFFLLLICSSLLAQANSPWQCLDAELQKVRFFPQNGLVFILGNNGCLLRSTDSGTTWRQPFTGTLNNLRSLDFATPSIGVIVGISGVITRTTDGGKTWNLITSPTTNTLKSIQFVSAYVGFIVGNNGALLKTTDAGLSWQTMDFPYSFSINTISMDSPQTGIIAGESSNFFKTTDGGVHWQPQSIATLPIGNTIFQDYIRTNGKTYFWGNNLTTQKGVLISSNDGILFSASEIPFVNDIAIMNDSIYTINTSNGISKASLTNLEFSSVTMYDTNYLVTVGLARKNSLCFVSNTIALAVGERKFIYRTANTMESWDLICIVSGYSYNDPVGPPAFLKVKFLDDSTGYLVGALRAIYHTTNGGATWLPQRSTSIPLYEMNDIAFTSPTHGLAVASNAKYSVVKTTNGGNTFFPNDTTNQGFMQVGDKPLLRFFGDSLGMISGSYISPTKGVINLTYDGGKTWKKRIFDVGFTDGCWADDSTILLSGDRIMISRDRGITWDSITFPFSQQQLGCWAIDSKNLLVTGGYTNKPVYYGLIFRSADGGKTWKIVDSSTDVYSYSAISFTNKNLGYTISRSLMQTKDGGNTWQAIVKKSPLDSGYFIRLAALPSGNVVLTTQPNAVLRSNFEESVLAVDEPKTILAFFPSIWLYAPRPLPTTGKITLDAVWLSYLDVSTIRIKLYDMLGVELRDITDSFYPTTGANVGTIEFVGEVGGRQFLLLLHGRRMVSQYSTLILNSELVCKNLKMKFSSRTTYTN